MKQLAKILGLLLATSSGLLATATVANKTYMRRRSDLSNLGLEWTTKNHYQADCTDKNIGAQLMVSGFYRENMSNASLGHYYGNSTNSIAISNGAPYIITDKTGKEGGTSAYAQKLYGYMIDHSPSYSGSIANPPMHGVVSLKPSIWAVGLHFNFEQSLDRILEGLKVQFATPLVHEETSMGAAFTGTASNITGSDGSAGKTLADYFTGSLIKSAAKVTQSALTHAKVKNGAVSATNLGDVMMRLIWNALKRERYSFDIGATAVLPTGNRSDNKYLLEPIAGGNGHVELGACANLSGNMKLEKFDARISGIASIDYRYVFSATEKRILGVYSRGTKADVQSAQYRQMMKDGQAGVFPAANILSQQVSVTPGHQVEGLVGLSAQWKGFTFDVGYNLYWSEQEYLEVPTNSAWANDTYAFAEARFDKSQSTIHLNKIGGAHEPANNAVISDATDEPSTVSSFGPVQTTSSDISNLVQRAGGADGDVDPNIADPAGTKQKVLFHLSTLPAQTPAQTIHSVVAGAGYKFTGKYPVIVGLGGKVDFADSQKTTPENWSVWAKAGLCF